LAAVSQQACVGHKFSGYARDESLDGALIAA
jgi:hypothetical protein